MLLRLCTCALLSVPKARFRKTLMSKPTIYVQKIRDQLSSTQSDSLVLDEVTFQKILDEQKKFSLLVNLYLNSIVLLSTNGNDKEILVYKVDCFDDQKNRFIRRAQSLSSCSSLPFILTCKLLKRIYDITAETPVEKLFSFEMSLTEKCWKLHANQARRVYEILRLHHSKSDKEACAAFKKDMKVRIEKPFLRNVGNFSALSPKRSSTSSW
uniref:Histone acetyltransferase type B catalytic subunit n=1 Tax=Ditylenchus dipsaci TaxID=166011 RepID=A0A915CVL9_9BILA